MTIFNLGSINADHIYRVPHFPAPGETLAATSYTRNLGGKGANMSVAMTRARRKVVHIGAVGSDGGWALDMFKAEGIDTRHIHLAGPTGHAIIHVDDTGENAITIVPGANREIPISAVSAALAKAVQGDIFLFQNETNLQPDAARLAKARGMFIVYAAAPFDAAAVQAVLPHLDLLIMNEGEAAQLSLAMSLEISDLPVANVIVTLGAKGCRWFNGADASMTDYPAPKVNVVDTTGAGDTFTGYLVAGLDGGNPIRAAIGDALAAAAIMVTRHGTANVIPTLDEVRR